MKTNNIMKMLDKRTCFNIKTFSTNVENGDINEN